MTSASQEATAGGSFNGKDLLKLSQDDGSWLAGQDGYSVNGNVVINPASFRRGHVAWENYQIVGEVMGSVADPVTPIHELPPVQSKSGWQEQWSFEAAEPETGAQLMFKSSSMGGVEAVKALIGAVGSQLVTDPEHPVAEVMLRHTSYISKAKKKVFKPTFNLAAWHTPDSMNLLDSPSQPEPQPETRPAPTPPADRQRQRRSAV
jgi:hypothetical protein